MAPACAVAGSYHDFLCRIPYGPEAGRAAPTADVSYATLNGPFLSAGDGCESGGALSAAMDGLTTHPYGARAMVTFTAPVGLEISGFVVWRYEADVPGQPFGTPESKLEYIPGPASVQGLCTEGCSRGTSQVPLNASNAVSVGSLGSEKQSLSGVTQIRWNAACGGGPGGTCPASGSGTLSSQYDIYAADIDLVDDTPPSVSDVSGPLVAGATLSGEQSVSFDAADGQSGVYGGSLVVDGHTVVSQVLDSDEGRCRSLGITNDGQRSFEYAQPCPPSVSASLTLDTSTLAPGQHSLELVVEDAAGNQTIAYDGTITVGGSSSAAAGSAASAVIGPGSPLALRGPANGTNASDEAKLTARWQGTNGVTRTSRYGQAERITGHLMTSAGQPISGALLDVSEIQSYQGAKTVPLSGVRTGSAGSWAVTLRRDISSSTLRFAYRGHVNDTVATATLTLRVHAGIVLRIAPRVTSVGRTIYFSGVLRGAPIPRGGKQLVLEASSGGEWVEFDTLTTGAKGRFYARHRFRLPGPATYRFRVLCPYEADFTFLGGVSNVVVVRER